MRSSPRESRERGASQVRLRHPSVLARRRLETVFGLVGFTNQRNMRTDIQGAAMFTHFYTHSLPVICYTRLCVRKDESKEDCDAQVAGSFLTDQRLDETRRTLQMIPSTGKGPRSCSRSNSHNPSVYPSRRTGASENRP